jgi:hypothetical protein
MMPRSSRLRRVVGALALGGFLAGCGADGIQTSEQAPPESKPGETGSSKTTLPKSKLPKNVNPNASNRGLKGKYAD